MYIGGFSRVQQFLNINYFISNSKLLDTVLWNLDRLFLELGKKKLIKQINYKNWNGKDSFKLIELIKV